MIQEVGFDSLPNSYISMIEISKFSELVNSVHVHVILKDIKKDGLFSWYNRGDLGKYLKLLIVSSSIPEINSAIDNGQLPLDRVKISSHPSFDSTKVQFRETKVGWDKRQILTDGKTTVDGELFELEFGDRFYIKTDELNLKVYCATYVDTHQYAQDYRLDLSHFIISTYTGPVASESVLSNGEVVSTSFVFKTVQNTIWGGPTRFVNGVYYSGSKGEATPSEALRRIPVPNVKIKDYRKPKLMRVEPSPVVNKLPPFPSPSYSYNPDGSLSALFPVDLRALLLKRSRIAAKLAIVDEKLLQKVLQKIQLNKLVIKKQKIITKPVTSRSGNRMKKTGSILHTKVLANTKDSAPFQLIPASSDEANLEEIVLTETPSVRHFALRDYNNYTSKGEYEYILEIEFDDPTKEFVDNLANEVEMNLSELKKYVERSQMPHNLNNSRTRLTDKFVQDENSRLGSENQPWNKATQLFTTYYSMFVDLDDTRTKNLAKQTVAKIHPLFATPISIQHFVKEYSELHQHFIRYLSPVIKRVSNLKGRTTKGKAADQNKIFAKVAYRELVVHEERENTIIYYDFKEDIYPVVTIKELISRTQKEEGKFYNSKPSLAGTNLSKMSKKVAQKLTKDASKITGFLTPSKIRARTKEVNLENPATVDLDSFNTIFKQVSNNSQLESVEPRKIRKSKLNIKVAKKIDKYLEPSKKETKTVTENLGKTSKFIASEEVFKPVVTAKLASKIRGKVKEINKRKISINQFAADSDRMKQFIKKADKVRLPPSLISIIASESKSVKNNSLTISTDLASNPETKDFFTIMYTNPVQIEVIESYKKDAKGRAILNSPIWKLLDEKDLESTTPLVCRFSVYNSKMFETQGIDMNIANENFILQPNSIITKKFNVEETISLKSIISIVDSSENSVEKQTSNSVTQSQDKAGPIR